MVPQDTVLFNDTSLTTSLRPLGRSDAEVESGAVGADRQLYPDVAERLREPRVGERG